MLKKTFTNKQLGFELTSFIDNKQNIWFRGKDVAEILGYRDTDDAVRRHVSIENKMTQFLQPKCFPGKTPGQQNDTKVKCSPGKTPGQQNDTKVKCSSFIYLLFASAYLFDMCDIPPRIPFSNIINIS